MTKPVSLKYTTKPGTPYQFSIRKYEVLIINKNHPMTEKIAYLLVKSLWNTRQAMNDRGWVRSLKRPRNGDMSGIPKNQQRILKQNIEVISVKKGQIVYSKRRKKYPNPSWRSGGFVYFPPPCLQALNHPIHKNGIDTIKSCELLYMYTWR